MSDTGSNAFIEADLHIEATQQGPLTGLTFAAKDLFDVSTEVADNINCTQSWCSLAYSKQQQLVN